MSIQACYLSVKKNLSKIFTPLELELLLKTEESIDESDSSTDESSFEGVTKTYRIASDCEIFTPISYVDKSKKIRHRLQKGWTSEVSRIAWQLFKKPCCFIFKDHVLKDGELYCNAVCKECDNFINVKSSDTLTKLNITLNEICTEIPHKTKIRISGKMRENFAEKLEKMSSMKLRKKIINENMHVWR